MQTIDELKRLQAQPLEKKIVMTSQRIRQWVARYGEDGVYVSFSGGKDSTVLLDIVRNVCGYKNIPAVFVDVPTQYPELRTFAETFDNLIELRPKISFVEVCEKYGFPFISKEVSEKAMYARRYLARRIGNEKTEHTDRQIYPYAFAVADFLGIERRNKKNQETFQKIKMGTIHRELLNELFSVGSDAPMKAKCLFGTVLHKEKGVVTGEVSKRYDYSRYKFLINAPFNVSNECCDVMKKKPIKEYAKRTGRCPITAQMADESRLRQQQWIRNGCNGFEMKSPVSNPMSFWTENDVLEYIATTGIQICSVYGDIVEDYGKEIDGQISLADFGCCEKKCKYKTTGCKRTGCMLCGFGCHLEKPGEGRFIKLKQTHPKMLSLLDVCKNNGVTFREAIEWTNEHGNLHIEL